MQRLPAGSVLNGSVPDEGLEGAQEVVQAGGAEGRRERELSGKRVGKECGRVGERDLGEEEGRREETRG